MSPEFFGAYKCAQFCDQKRVTVTLPCSEIWLWFELAVRGHFWVDSYDNGSESHMEALINPNLLRWARERASLSTGTLAKSLGTLEDNVLAWEQGKKKPSFNQAMNYTRHTYVPFGYLYLTHPPEENLLPPDLRTINGNASTNTVWPSGIPSGGPWKDRNGIATT
jgi:DNA-binding XRE family transcriptional regulator